MAKYFEVLGDYQHQIVLRNWVIGFLLLLLAVVTVGGYFTIIMVYDKPTGFLERLPDGSVRTVRLAEQVQIVPSDILNFSREFVENTVRVDFAILEDQQANAMSVMSKPLRETYEKSLQESDQIREVKRLGLRSRLYYMNCKCTDSLEKDAEIKNVKPGVWQVNIRGWRETVSVARNGDALPRWPFTASLLLQQTSRNELTRYGLFLTAFDVQPLSERNLVDAGIQLAPSQTPPSVPAVQTAQPVPSAGAPAATPVAAPQPAATQAPAGH